MNIPDTGPALPATPVDPGALTSGAGAPASAPDVSVIAQLANALFKTLPGQPPAAGGIVLGTPAAPAVPPAPHALPAQPSTPALGAYAPGQPPLGPIDGPPTAIPTSAPGPLFGGASSPSAPPAPLSQAAPPAFFQVAQPVSLASPFATEPDLRSLPRFFESALAFATAPTPPAHPAAPAIGAETPAPPASPIESPASSIPPTSVTRSAPSAASTRSQPDLPPSPFASEADWRSLPRSLESALAFLSPPDDAADLPAPDAGAPDGYYFLNEGRAAPAPSPPTAPASPPSALAEPPPLAPDFLVLRADQTPDLTGARRPFDAHAVKRDFPILQTKVHGRPLIWLDNGATTQKPRSVIDRLQYFYENENSNIHRGAHTLAAKATDAYEGARDKVRRFIGAGSPEEIIFVRGATEGINLVAQSWGRRYVKRATRSSSPGSNITPISCPGSNWLPRAAQNCASRRSTTMATCGSTNMKNCSGRARASSP
jgi:cysteine desulfurase / selenocysteine lyase